MAVKLRDHQIEAVAAIVRGFDIPPGGIPFNGLRGQIHAACGTGKTIIAAASAKRIVPKGRTLVLVPTLDLLTQTVQAWRAAGHMGPHGRRVQPPGRPGAVEPQGPLHHEPRAAGSVARLRARDHLRDVRQPRCPRGGVRRRLWPAAGPGRPRRGR